MNIQPHPCWIIAACYTGGGLSWSLYKHLVLEKTA